MPKTTEKPGATRIPLDDAIDMVLENYREVLEADDTLLLEEWNAHHVERAVKIDRSKKGGPALVLEGAPDRP